MRPSGGRNSICTYGAFKRDCCYGWKRNERGICQPICERSCGKHGTCVSYNRCKCHPGWLGEYCEADMNECAVHPCEHRCMNTDGSYKCYCEHGYIIMADGRSCSRDDRCYSSRCQFGCIQYNDGFNCFCPEGLKLTEDGLGCEDVNECEEGLAKCPRGRRCANTYGNYLCLCPEGYKYQYVSGKLTCVDDNECQSNRDRCNVNARCENQPGGFACVCNAGYIGTGEQCLTLGRDTCAQNPCFEGVRCNDLRINVNTLDYTSQEEAKRYECGPCPPGHVGDGVTCVASNVDVTILVLEQMGGTPVADVKVRSLDVTNGGTEFAQAFTGANGIAKLPVPNDANIVVVASKTGHPTASTTFNVRNNENNLVTLTLTRHNDGAEFPYPQPRPRTFTFTDPNTPDGQLQVEIPARGLNVSEGSTISLSVRTVDVSNPQDVRNVPELATQGSGPARLEALAVAEIELTDSKTGEKVDLTESATIRIPLSDRFEPRMVGSTVPAWYFNEAIGLWVQDGIGTVEEDGQGGLVWVYQTEHFTWWAVGDIWPGMQLVTIKTCFTEDCSVVAPNTGIQLWGVDYLYEANLITTKTGTIVTFVKTNAAIRLIHNCGSEESEEYIIVPETVEIVYKVSETVNYACKDPGQVTEGVRQGDDFSFGAEVTYFCNPEYMLHGSSRRVCTPCGEWSGFQPFCETDVTISSISSLDSSSTSTSSSPAELYTSEPELSGDGPL
ncbi:uncharacterized protein LOC115918503 [Strongylocentrotus purpuratus]|uniref:Uncharacterized protein n=1 Tax=Strongylocentrotus purpuratus TaxID=7668 RepID=A0A7M7HDQ0_STRPU|nr:uncharacterized protein LOC582269 [Strongylocentrotus purpuratus]XP_030836746.1 uncharacterized protein LOC115918503 [Strongylocentrotus purpuratus]